MRCYTNVSKSLRRDSLVQRTRRQARCLLQMQLLLCQLSSWLIFSLVKSIILVIGESPTTIIMITRNPLQKYHVICTIIRHPFFFTLNIYIYIYFLEYFDFLLIVQNCRVRSSEIPEYVNKSI